MKLNRYLKNFLFSLDFSYSIYRSEIRQLLVYVTNRCNSRCKTCNIWMQEPKQDINIYNIQNVLQSGKTRNPFVKLCGGEPILHPEIDKLLILLNESGVKYQLLSNAIAAEKLISLTRQYGIKELTISCDGIGKRYEQIRGIDNFQNIVKVVGELKDETNLTLNYTISPYNQKKDLEEVNRFVIDEEVNLSIGIFGSPDFFGVKRQNWIPYDLKGLDLKNLEVPQFFFERYLNYFKLWLQGDLQLPCYNIRGQVAIYPNGDVNICENKQIKLGNLNSQSFDTIWNSEETKMKHEDHVNCNGCFLYCEKPIDLFIKKFPLLERMIR